jgi:hypothetical protein
MLRAKFETGARKMKKVQTALLLETSVVTVVLEIGFYKKW